MANDPSPSYSATATADSGASPAPVPVHKQMTLDDILFTLSVNFLLYAVLIIVFYMVVKYYIDDKDYSYLYNDKVLNDHVSQENNQTRAGGYSALRTEDFVDADSGEQQSNAIENDKNDGTRSNSNNNNNNNNNSSSRSSSSDGKSQIEMTNSQKIFLNLNDEEKLTKEEAFTKLAFCSGALWISFGVWGLVQERLLTKPYDGEYFEYSYGLVFITRMGGLVLSIFLMYYFNISWVSSPLWEYSFPSVANILSSWCQYEALKYVSFPSVMLAKAFKMVPIMLMGWFMHGKSYKSYEYLSAAFVGFGLYLFLNSSEHIDLKTNSLGDPENVTGATCGVVLLFMFLFFDSMTGQWQTRMFKMYKQMSPVQMMLIMNVFSSLFSFVTLINQDELGKSLGFVYNHKESWLHLFVFTVAATLGQVAIFYTVKFFGPVVFSIIMSFRILLSTILSCWFYNHPITELGVLGMFIVFGATAYRYQQKTKGKQLIAYTNESPENAKQVLHEWHEHLDC